MSLSISKILFWIVANIPLGPLAPWVLGLALGRKPQVVYPFRPLVEAMHAKDPELFAEVGPLSPSVAIEKWREKYPEDFREVR